MMMAGSSKQYDATSGITSFAGEGQGCKFDRQDRWASRGGNKSWVREHRTLRTSLCSPMGIPRGPGIPAFRKGLGSDDLVRELGEDVVPERIPLPVDVVQVVDAESNSWMPSSHGANRDPKVKVRDIGGTPVRTNMQVRISPSGDVHFAQQAYSVVYGNHPKYFACVGPVGQCVPEPVPPSSDPATGLSTEEMATVRNGYVVSEESLQPRAQILRHTSLEGANWETSSAACLAAFAVAKKNKRLGANAVNKQDALEDVVEVLTDAQSRVFRALAARCGYPSLDRPDMAVAAKELCRAFARPTRKDVEALEHVTRYLVHTPRLMYDYKCVDINNSMEVFVDTDFAGCQHTRRSTSGGAIVVAGHLLKHWSSTQATIALSSGEVELCGIVKCATHALGFQRVAAVLGVKLSINMWSGATAAMGTCRRRGLGKVRHLSCADLWIQERLRAGELTLSKILGSDNPAACLTPFVGRPSLHKLLPLMGLSREEGRAQSAPQLAQCITFQIPRDVPLPCKKILLVVLLRDIDNIINNMHAMGYVVYGVGDGGLTVLFTIFMNNSRMPSETFFVNNFSMSLLDVDHSDFSIALLYASGHGQDHPIIRVHLPDLSF